MIFREIEDIKRCVIGGHNVNNHVRYADDTALLEESEEQLQAIADKEKD